jgi:hypothetical protein
MGTVETRTPGDRARNYAALLFSFGLGPKPPPEPKTTIQKIKHLFISPPKQINPSDKYIEISISDADD